MTDTLNPRSHFDQEMRNLQDAILRMGGMVERNIYQAVEALKNRNLQLAEQVISADLEVDELENEVEEECIRLIALRQPMAKDLRAITTAMKITHELERMGDLAVNIAERNLELCEEPPVKPLIDIPRMAEHAQEMLRKGLDAFIREDTRLALEVCDSDDLLDGLNGQIFRELISFMIEDPKTISRATRLVLVSRYLERFGDHATNIGELVVFMVEGRNIRHARKLGKIPECGPAASETRKGDGEKK
jgi:phosphate transport system protein